MTSVTTNDHRSAAPVGASESPRATPVRTPAWEALAAALPLEELSGVSGGPSVPALGGSEAALQELAGTLFRSQRCHPLLVGLPGIGKTYLVRQLAARNAGGEFPFLAQRRFIRLDCRNVGPEDSRACLELVFAAVAHLPDLVLCIDGLAALLRRVGGQSNRAMFCNLLSRASIRVIGIMTPWDYGELVAGDAEMLRHLARVELSEPSEDDVIAITNAQADWIASKFGLTVEPTLGRKIVTLTSAFLLNEYHPAKDLAVLREACERLRYDQGQRGETRSLVTEHDVITVLHDRTGIPRETLLGNGSAIDFVAALSAAVVGQPAAVETAARELRLIQAGLSPSGKPATVMLFAGLTGVGKTELAKRIAEVYSTSRRLQVYAMGNFTEPHSVSGIIGVPPGYVGHDQGGRLVNDLNADPYSVFLLDEAEKCHPNVWKPFLNLFDEGWIADQRGVKAYADRAIFLLTTNAGDRQIAQLSEAGKSEEEIGVAVRQTLARIRVERSTQPVFPPQFLSRIRRIVVFRPLSEDALICIAEQAGRRLASRWERHRQSEVRIAPMVLRAIGRLAHRLNVASHQQEGGRIVQKLIDELVQDGLQSREMEVAKVNRCATRSWVVSLRSSDEPVISADELRCRLMFEFFPGPPLSPDSTKLGQELWSATPDEHFSGWPIDSTR